MKPNKNNDLSETHPLFPSGDWEGFYTYAFGPGADRHSMAFHLDFQNNQVSGAGGDDVGPFRWRQGSPALPDDQILRHAYGFLRRPGG